MVKITLDNKGNGVVTDSFKNSIDALVTVANVLVEGLADRFNITAVYEHPRRRDITIAIYEGGNDNVFYNVRYLNSDGKPKVIIYPISPSAGGYLERIIED